MINKTTNAKTATAIQSIRKRVNRIVFAILLVVLAIVGETPQKALAVDPPTSYSIVYAYGYTGLAETGDLFWLVEINVAYSSYPTEAISNTWVVRVLNNGTTELASAVPFNNPYFHDGYGYQVVGVYLSAADVATKGAVYGSANYTVSLEANVSASWNGTIPSPTTRTITWISLTTFFGTATNMRGDLRAKILAAASDFRTRWSLAVNLAESGSLTSDGENYFTGAIPNLRELCPEVFSSFITSPTYRRRTFSATYALTLRNQWVGTWLDMTNVAADWGVNAIWVYGVMWVFVLVAACWGVATISNSNQGLYWTVTMGVAVGAFIGFLPWSALGLDAVLAVLIIVNEMLYKRSPS